MQGWKCTLGEVLEYLQYNVICVFLKTSSSQDWSLRPCHPLTQHISATENAIFVLSFLNKSEPCIWRWPGWWPLARWGSIRTLGGTGSDTEKWNSCVILFFHSNTRDQMLVKICISQLKFLPVCIPTRVYQWPLDRRGSKGQSWSFVLHLKSFTVATS